MAVILEEGKPHCIFMSSTMVSFQRHKIKHNSNPLEREDKKSISAAPFWHRSASPYFSYKVSK